MKAAFRSLPLAVLAASYSPATAQTVLPGGNVMLIADRVTMPRADLLVAEGHVEALQGDVRIRATRVEYDSAENTVKVSGPIYLEQGDSVRVLADYGELGTDFRDALLRSARVVLDQQLQMAAAQLNRVDGRYNVLTKATVSSCRVCDDGKPPLWQIRAKRVVHDQQEQQIYFDHAQFRIMDVPVAYFPQLRLPDPTLKRASGFLIPALHHNSQLGFGVKIPYFLKLGDYRDLTLTPYLGEHTRTLEFRYRQAFRSGRINIEGAGSHDSILTTHPRGYLFADGWFSLPKDYNLSFHLKATSDDAYLLDYDYSDDDRLNSDVTVRRTKRDENTRLAILHYQSLRDTEDNNTLPSLVGIAETERRFFPRSIGGEARVGLKLHSHYRRSDSDVDGTDSDSIVDGRDVTRTTASVSWRRNWTSAYGLRTGVIGDAAFDATTTKQDATLAGTDTDFTPTVAARISYPMAKVGRRGSTYVLEPVAQIAWTGGATPSVANDESTRVEFDEGNLLSLSRFPSEDRRERGASAALGMNWTRFTPNGWQGHLSLGQVYHRTAQSDFSQSSGLSGTRSDLLMAGQITTRNGLSIMARGLFDWANGFDKATARVGWTNKKVWLDASYIWLDADADEDRTSTLSEWVMDSRYRMSRHWTALADWRYDVATRQSSEAGIGLEYRNECVQIGLSFSRNFTTTGTVEPSTDIGLTVTLLGFSVRSADKSYNRTCKQNAG